ncbi:TonB C-terminal domain-containing protein [Pleurocapsales cyanobacterium LEGE 06147]|nr:TonB C-terminal domain-containing protein [Pleurocapsales cyanobacterium LEGE 06147]
MDFLNWRVELHDNHVIKIKVRAIYLVLVMTSLEQNRSHRQIHSHSLLPYFLVSLLIHGLAALVIVLQERSQPVTKQQQDNSPIEFIIVPSEESADRPPPETNRRAANNSIAQGKVKSELPPVTDKRGDTATNSSPVSTPEVASSQSEIKPSEVVKPTPSVASKPEPVQPPQPPTPTTSEPEPVQPPQPPTPTTSEPEPVQPPQPPTPTTSEPEPVQPPQPPTPTTSEPQAVAPSPSVDSPTTKVPAKETPTNSSAASLLGGTYRRSIEEDGGSSFFDSEALAKKEAPYAKLDARQDDLAPYFDEIRRRVKRNWQPSSPGDDRNTVIAFAIEPNGQITGLRIVETSGKERVDRDALEAIQKSAPFDPLPQSFQRDRLEIQFNFNIYIHQRSFSPNLIIPYP